MPAVCGASRQTALKVDLFIVTKNIPDVFSGCETLFQSAERRTGKEIRLTMKITKSITRDPSQAGIPRSAFVNDTISISIWLPLFCSLSNYGYIRQSRPLIPKKSVH